MCTLVVFKDMSPGSPLVIAANRDENPLRMSCQPRYVSPTTYAPGDLRRGGTWIGVNRYGVAVAITNRDAEPVRKSPRSRGLLVMDCLAAPTFAAAVMNVMRSDPAHYSGFHLVIADAEQACLVWNDGVRISRREIPSGVHAITSFGIEPGHCARDVMVRMHVLPEHVDDDAALERLLSFHGPGPEDGTCVHGEGVIMETLSSMTVRLPADRSVWRVRWRNGRPCEGGKWHSQEIPLINE